MLRKEVITSLQVIPEFGTDDLEMSSALKEAIGSVVRFEKARSCVYGSWESTSIHKLASGFIFS